MTPARRRALTFVTIVLTVAAATIVLVRHRGSPPSTPVTARPKLLLLTSLPLVFSEDFTLSGSGSPAFKSLSAEYQVLPISVADPADLAKGKLLMMAQPPTQTAENLVALDEWVRRGGHLLLLADPLLEWPSKRPLGDPLRPPPVFMDTGLLAHWGLRLDEPDSRGPATRKLGGYEVETVSPGSLGGTCAISDDRLVARCRIGAGSATVIADADFLDVADLGAAAEHNLDALRAELARVARK